MTELAHVRKTARKDRIRDLLKTAYAGRVDQMNVGLAQQMLTLPDQALAELIDLFTPERRAAIAAAFERGAKRLAGLEPAKRSEVMTLAMLLRAA